MTHAVTKHRDSISESGAVIDWKRLRDVLESRDVMGHPDHGRSVDVMGYPDFGRENDVMGGPDWRHVLNSRSDSL
jgi:hypothetical protein